MGLKVSEQFASNFFKAEDFDKKGRNLVMASVEVEEVGKESKLVLHFKGEDKTLPLNKTNALVIAELHGDDVDDWDGNAIRVYRDSTMFNGKKVACMRVGSAD